MPMPSRREAPRFSSATLSDFNIFFSDVSELAKRSNLEAADTIRWALRYAGSESESWQHVPCLAAGCATPPTFDEFKREVLQYYPHLSEVRRYTLRNLEQLVSRTQSSVSMSHDDLGLYYRRFITYSTYLITQGRLSVREKSAMYLRGFPSPLCTRVLGRLALKQPDVFPCDGYAFADIHNAAVFVLDLDASDLSEEPKSHRSSSASREPESVRKLMQKMVEVFAAKAKSQDISPCDSTPSPCPPTPGGVAQNPPQQDLARSDDSSQSSDFCWEAECVGDHEDDHLETVATNFLEVSAPPVNDSPVLEQRFQSSPPFADIPNQSERIRSLRTQLDALREALARLEGAEESRTVKPPRRTMPMSPPSLQNSTVRVPRTPHQRHEGPAHLTDVSSTLPNESRSFPRDSTAENSARDHPRPRGMIPINIPLEFPTESIAFPSRTAHATSPDSWRRARDPISDPRTSPWLQKSRRPTSERKNLEANVEAFRSALNAIVRPATADEKPLEASPSMSTQFASLPFASSPLLNMSSDVASDDIASLASPLVPIVSYPLESPSLVSPSSPFEPLSLATSPALVSDLGVDSVNSFASALPFASLASLGSSQSLSPSQFLVSSPCVDLALPFASPSLPSSSSVFPFPSIVSSVVPVLLPSTSISSLHSFVSTSSSSDFSSLLDLYCSPDSPSSLSSSSSLVSSPCIDSVLPFASMCSLDSSVSSPKSSSIISSSSVSLLSPFVPLHSSPPFIPRMVPISWSEPEVPFVPKMVPISWTFPDGSALPLVESAVTPLVPRSFAGLLEDSLQVLPHISSTNDSNVSSEASEDHQDFLQSFQDLSSDTFSSTLRISTGSQDESGPGTLNIPVPPTFRLLRDDSPPCSPRFSTTNDLIILPAASNDSRGSPQPSLRVLRSNGSTSSATTPEGSQKRHPVPLAFPPLRDEFPRSLHVSDFLDVLGPFPCLSFEPIEPDLISPVITAKSNPPPFAARSLKQKKSLISLETSPHPLPSSGALPCIMLLVVFGLVVFTAILPIFAVVFPAIFEVPSWFENAQVPTFLSTKHFAPTSSSSSIITNVISQVPFSQWRVLSSIPPCITALDDFTLRNRTYHDWIDLEDSQMIRILEPRPFDVGETILETSRSSKSKWRTVLPRVFWMEQVMFNRSVSDSTGDSPSRINFAGVCRGSSSNSRISISLILSTSPSGNQGWLVFQVPRRCPASILGRARDAILRELSSLLREWEGSHPLQPRTLSILLRASLPDVSRLASPFRVSLLDAFPFPFEMFAFVP
jgi:hypothetical protein